MMDINDTSRAVGINKYDRIGVTVNVFNIKTKLAGLMKPFMNTGLLKDAFV